MDCVDEDVCKKVLSQIVGGNFVVEGWRLEFFNELVGFQGEHGKLKIDYKSGDSRERLTFFYKGVSRWKEIQDEYLSFVRLYLKEHHMNVRVLKCFETEVSVKLSAKCYLSVVDSFLVMEDLAHLGFKTQAKWPLDRSHARLVIDKLAALHAASFIVEKRNGKPVTQLFPEINFETLFNDVNEGSGLTHKALVNLMEFALSEKITGIEERGPFIEWMRDLVQRRVRPSGRFRNCVLHGDPWGGNIMYRYENNVPVEAVLVDFQLSRISPPALEILLFLELNLNSSERQHLFTPLLDSYYDSLKRFLSSADIHIDSVLPQEEFLSSLEAYKPLVSCLKTYYTFFIRLPKDLAKKSTETAESYLKLLTVGNRELIGEAFDTSQEFKDALTETITESYNFYLKQKIQN